MVKKIIFIWLCIFIVWMNGPFIENPDKEPLIAPEEISTNKDLPDSHKNFIAWLYPKIANVNAAISADRESIIALAGKYEMVTGEGKKLILLNHISEVYRLGENYFTKTMSQKEYTQHIDSLLHRVDLIPEKLILAQAIIESGWGQSKFSKKYHNYFGIRCFTRGCGFRPAGTGNTNLWFKKFPTVEACIDEYLWILNTGSSYTRFRDVRRRIKHEMNFDNMRELVKTLKPYSELKNNYTSLVISIIRDYLPQNPEAFTRFMSTNQITPDFHTVN